jgi:hypothetical protein
MQLKIDAATIFLPVAVASGFPALWPAVLRSSLFTFTMLIYIGLIYIGLIYTGLIFAELIRDSIIGCRFGGRVCIGHSGCSSFLNKPEF